MYTHLDVAPNHEQFIFPQSDGVPGAGWQSWCCGCKQGGRVFHFISAVVVCLQSRLYPTKLGKIEDPYIVEVPASGCRTQPACSERHPMR
jgi:hypothetical protein